jgi:hypothetical protein
MSPQRTGKQIGFLPLPYVSLVHKLILDRHDNLGNFVSIMLKKIFNLKKLLTYVRVKKHRI